MKNALVLTVAIVILISSCKKSGGEKPKAVVVPTLTTTAASAVTATSAQSGGTITSDGGAPVIARGICWSTLPQPTTSNDKTTDGSGSGTFSSTLLLLPNTTYSVRSYATNSAGTAYGNEFIIVTPKQLSAPTVTTTAISVVNNATAVTGGTVVSDGNVAVTARGVCWSTTQNPTIADSKTIDGAGTGGFVSGPPNLTVNTTYYLRAYATNSIGTGYGNQVSFTTAYLIGQLYGGGKIFYVDNTKEHGLIVATVDQSSGARWDNTTGPFVSPGAYSATDGAGNTTKIIAKFGSGQNAAAICRAYRGGGYSDWFLPAKDQLWTLYQQKDKIGGFNNYYYWSSTESSSYIAWAWYQGFPNGPQWENFKTEPYLVRAIRAF